LIDFGFWFVVETDFKAWHNNVCNGMENAGIVCVSLFFSELFFSCLLWKKQSLPQFGTLTVGFFTIFA